MDKIYLVQMKQVEDESELTVGYATTEEKAEQMVKELKTKFKDAFEYEIIFAFTDMLIMDDKRVLF